MSINKIFNDVSKFLKLKQDEKFTQTKPQSYYFVPQTAVDGWLGNLHRNFNDAKVKTSNELTDSLALSKSLLQIEIKSQDNINGLQTGKRIPIKINSDDTQETVLRRTYETFADQAGLSNESKQKFVNQMFKSGGTQILHAGTNTAFTDAEFAAKKMQGSIEMIPTESQIAELRLLKVGDLLSYGVFDWSVSAADERQIVDLLKNDPNLSQTIKNLNQENQLEALIARVDEPATRRELIQTLAVKSDNEASRLIESQIERLDISPATARINQNVWQVKYNLIRLGVLQSAQPFNREAYSNLISNDPSAPFTGVSATGINPSTLSVPLTDQVKLLYEKKIVDGTQETEQKYSNPVGGLDAYIDSLSAEQRKRQVELLVNQPISTTMPDLYGDQLPSRSDVIRAAAEKYNLEPELITAFILAEGRDQSQREDAAEYAATVSLVQYDGSIGLGQVLPSTARNYDLFADLLPERTRRDLLHNDTARLLASDEVNIFATARYIRQIADAGARADINKLPITKAIFPDIDLQAYARHSSTWSESNIRALGSEYTSKAWDDNIMGWEDFVFKAYEDAKSSDVFHR